MRVLFQKILIQMDLMCFYFLYFELVLAHIIPVNKYFYKDFDLSSLALLENDNNYLQDVFDIVDEVLFVLFGYAFAVFAFNYRKHLCFVINFGIHSKFIKL